MGAIARLHFFRLADQRVQCDENGCFVGSVALLCRSPISEIWSARPSEELDDDLSVLYGWPIDAAAKRRGLAIVADGLQRGEMALAKIATLLLRFPEPPALAKDRGMPELAERLFESGLLKGGWDPAAHPRTGETPNRGWFARKPEAPDAPPSRPAAPKGQWLGIGESVGKAMIKARALLKETGAKAVETGEVAVWLDPELKVAIEAVIETLELLEPSDLNANEQQAIDQARAAADPPKPLEALQQPPVENMLGYEQHHIVEQNDDNIAKSGQDILVVKFGRQVIDDPDNLVWVPRLKHELITGLYNSKAPADAQGRLYRQIVNAMDYPSQRAAGLAALRQFGVLQ